MIPNASDMNVSSLPATPKPEWRRWGAALLLCLAAWPVLGVRQGARAQPPGTFPPADVIRPSQETDPEKLPIKGFLFLDSAKNPVLIPGMTYERLTELELGSKSQTRRFIFNNVQINGRVEGNRAELSVEIRLTLDSTGGESIAIPLQMENFHRLAPPEFLSGSGTSKTLAVTVNQDSGGYQLLASAEETTEIAFRMQMSARVESDSANSLAFHLPASPVTLDLTTDSRNATGEIIGRGDEVIQTGSDEAGRTQFLVESSGGRFTLRWGALDRPVSVPLVEADSRVTMQWNSPQDQLIQNVQMVVRDLRGPVSGFRFRLPKDALLVDDPRLTASGQFVELSQPDPDDKELFQVAIPEEERRQRIDLDLKVQLPSEGASAENALPLQVPTLVGALRHQGTIEIETGDDYRLRWRERPYVQNVTTASADDSTTEMRSYTFRFNRGSFTLPLWLDATRRQHRVSTECDIELHDGYADLSLEIRSTGSRNRSRLLRVDLGDWQSPQITNALTGAPVPWYESGELIEIEMVATAMEEITPILIRGHRPLQPAPRGQDPPAQQVSIPVPHVVSSDDGRDPVTIQDAMVRLTGRGRRSLVVDLESSEHLERAGGLEDDEDQPARWFKVMPPESGAKIAGVMVEQPPRLIMEETALVSLSGDQLETVVNWVVESQVDLEGRLRVAIPEIPSRGSDTNAGNRSDGSPASNNPAPSNRLDFDAPSEGNGPWTVFVNDRIAEIRPVDRGPSRIDLVGDGTDLADSGSSQNSVSERDAGDATASDARASNARASETPSSSQAPPASASVSWNNVRMRTYEVISDELADGEMKLRFRSVRSVAKNGVTSKTIVPISLPRPLVEDITVRGDVQIDFVGDALQEIQTTEPVLADRLKLQTLPAWPIPARISPRTTTQSKLELERLVIRSAISETAQHDQVIASVVGSGDFELQLREVDLTEVQVTVNDTPVAFGKVDDRLVIPVPADQRRHAIDVRLWSDSADGGLLRKIEPLTRPRPGDRRLYWYLTVPADSHLLWSSSSAGRPMEWVFDRWRLVRRPLLTDTALVARVAPTELSPMPMGNRYLFSAMDVRSFRAYTASRTVLWLVVSGIIVLVTTLLTYLPATRNPLSAVVAIVAFAGLLSIAPDAAIMIGQIAMLALALVIVMLAIRSLVLPTPSRVLVSTRDSYPEPSTRTNQPVAGNRSASSITETRDIGREHATPAADEVAS
ncbi:hypothetical protein FYK55_06690 [Roseiconus nitratireducens]|uniref:Transmembrane protein n=1 Tax=Roseiconus nitratireducens TaxID=2605748 RepID=A0A5M6DCP7_9BACT|nr:hypothetical protein [Roseiconus nitratireducens]KAA5545337.1 hypothetical protein FYK55_06690 [Roseiconus nitratireducens]